MNPSWEIAALLPDYLPADRVKDAAHRSAASLPPVRIVKLPGPVRTSYEYARHLVPKLWDDAERKIDYAIHIGMAGPQLVYSIERRGHREGYGAKDVDGKLLKDEERHSEQGDRWIWHGVPHELLTDFDIDDVHRRWADRSPVSELCHEGGRGMVSFNLYPALCRLSFVRPITNAFPIPSQRNLDLRVSEDAGHYLCDFIYFSSLAHLWKQQRPKKVVFFHVPLHSDPASLERGVELVLTLIRSIVESETERKIPTA